MHVVLKQIVIGKIHLLLVVQLAPLCSCTALACATCTDYGQHMQDPRSSSARIIDLPVDGRDYERRS
ncbi:hypothetical protein D0A38_20105 [Xanthomonas campestris pv. incanae]|nr:hypothetical protein D0A38_20105 [Xanthomonas campestris pv. incanae]